MAASAALLTLAAVFALSLLACGEVSAQPAATTPLRGYNPAVWLGVWSGCVTLAAATENKHGGRSGHSLPHPKRSALLLSPVPLFSAGC